MDFQSSQLLSFCAPPLLGAFIGYLTNKVAIRMLFRPLKPWYILGVRVPMTPGIIPSKRHELAENIGEMVGRHLLTATDIGAALSAERFQEHLHQLVDGRVNDLLKKDLGPVLTVVPGRFQSYVKVGIKTVKYQMGEGLHSYVDSTTFADTVSDIVRQQLEGAGDAELNSLLPGENRQLLYRFVDRFIERVLAEPKLADRLGEYIAAYLQQAADEGQTVADLLPEELQELACLTIEKQAPRIVDRLAMMLAEPEVRDRIIAAIRQGVDHFLDTLGPMAAMARGFLDMDSLEKKIRAYLEEKEEELITWLQQPLVQERVAHALVEQTRKFFDTGLAELLTRIDGETLNRVCREGASQILAVVRSQGVQQALSNLLREQVEEMVDQGRIPLAELARMLLPGESGGRFRKAVVGELIDMLRSARVSRMLEAVIHTMVDMVTSRPLGVLYDLMPAGVRTGITDYVVLTANRMLLKEVPGLVDSLNIRELVTEKVDSLELLRLERLLLSIMEEQFKYINLFGALLGFLIGLINLAVLMLR